MKRILSFILTIAISVGFAVPSMAQNTDMQTALLGIKGRIEIPSEYTVFRSGVNDYGKILYNFWWSDKEEKEHLEVTADSKGRLINYYTSKKILTSDYPSLPTVDKDSAQRMADDFLKKAAPELVSDSKDRLEVATSSASMVGSRTWYSFSYKRVHNGTPVIENGASISIMAYSGGAFVSDANINWDYDLGFSEETATLENPERAYFDAFPTELRYERRYENIIKTLADGTNIIDDVVLIYGFEDGTGYISASDGRVLELDEEENRKFGGAGSSNEESMKEDMASDDMGFSEEELAEIERIEQLISAKDAERLLRSLPALKISDKMALKNTRIYRTKPWYLAKDNDVDKEQFMITISLFDEETDDNVSMTADAKTGEILGIFRYGGENSVSGSGNNETDAFLKAVAKEKTAECEKAQITEDDFVIRANMRRLVNGVPYNNNGITYTYSKKYSRINNYNLQWDDYTDFVAPENAMDAREAENKILSNAPLKTIYIPSGGEYRLCYTLSKTERNAKIDAVTGEQIHKDYQSERENISYTDISGHWAENAIKALAEVGIGEAASHFRPNEKMTQKELLVYLASALLGEEFWDYDEELFYNHMERRGNIKANEKAPSAAVIREDAFVYMIRLMGYDRVARLEGVYDCRYDDTTELSGGKMGYAAILTGFGVISGDGRNLRPRSEITRAECAMMVYKYLSYKGE